MFKDVKMSEQRMQDFKKTQFGSGLNIDLSVKVLTTGHWPNESRDPTAQNQTLAKENIMMLPPIIKNCMSIYKQYYLSKFSGRQLHWKLNQGYAEVKARIGNNGSKRYDFSVSTYQMCLMMLFNDNQQLNFHSILEYMQVNENDIKPHLIPLLQFKILQKTPVGKDFKMEDVYSVNFKFQNNQLKVKIPVMHSKT